MSGLEDLDTDEPLPQRLERHAFDRLIMLSDGVFAIAITLAALDLRPHGPWTTAAQLWAQLKLPLLAYFVSFAVTGAYWAAHRDTFARLRRVDTPVTLITLALLFMTALLPATTQILYQSDGASQGLQVYGATVIITGLTQTTLWTYASFRPGLMLPGVSVTYKWARVGAGLIIPVFFGWLVSHGAAGQSRLAIWGAIITVGLMVVVRRFLLPRLAGGPPA